jgi:SPP1 gp7 family putative phage head morphogenesis protein
VASLAHAIRIHAAMSGRPQLRRTKPPKVPRARFPTIARLQYYQALMGMVRAVQKLVVSELLPRLPAILDAHAVTRPARTDAKKTEQRVPKGSSHGGEWTSGGEGASAKSKAAAKKAEQLARGNAMRAKALEAGKSGFAKGPAHEAAKSAFAKDPALEGMHAELEHAHALDRHALKQPTLPSPFHSSGTPGAGPIEIPVDHHLRTRVEQVVAAHAHGMSSHGDLTNSTVAMRAATHEANADKAEQWVDNWTAGSSVHAANEAFAGLSVPGSFSHVQYAATQAVLRHHMPELQAKGIVDKDGYIRLERGVRHEQATALRGEFDRGATQATLGLRKTSSWTEAHAGDFALEGGEVVTQKVHHTRVLASWRTQGSESAIALAAQQEWVIIADKDVMQVHRKRPGARTDAAGDDIDSAFEKLHDDAAVAIPDTMIEMEAQKNALRVTAFQGAELTKQIQQVAKINLFDNTAGLAAHLDLFVGDNVQLVKSLALGQLDDLKGIVTRGARQGLHHTVIAAQIQERFGVTQRRAALIATDQVGKLNGELNQVRQQNLGLRRYRWSTSQDEKVRPGHRALNNTIQDWSKPPVVDQRTGDRAHPGQPVRCRCQAIPIVDDVLVDAGLMAPEDVELGQPLPGRTPTLPELPLGIPQPPPSNVATKAEVAAAAARDKAAAEARAALDLKTAVDVHEQALLPQYGRAARPVAWGRAMADRGRALPLDEFHAGVKSLSKLGVKVSDPRKWGFVNDLIATHKPATVDALLAALRDDPEISNVRRAVAREIEVTSRLLAHRQALAARTDVIDMADAKILTKRGSRATSNKLEDVVKRTRRIYESMSHRVLVQPRKYTFVADGNERAMQAGPTLGGKRGMINAGVGKRTSRMQQDMLHEWGHAIEALNDSRLARAVDFLDARTRGESEVELASLKGFQHYEPGERARPDGFFDPYMGKDYDAVPGVTQSYAGRAATEITSMAVQHLHDVTELETKVYRVDPDALDFLLGQLANQ